MSKFIVIGGAGFIGCHVVSELIKRKHKVVAIDDLSSGNKANLSGNLTKIKFIKGSITDFNLLKKAFKGCDYAIHLAALVSVPESVLDPISYHKVNVTGTFNVLEAARVSKVKKAVLASSSAAYGQMSSRPIKENRAMKPISPYGESKLINEKYAQMYYEVYKMPTVCLRFFNVYGPKQSLKSNYASVIPKFASSMQKGQRPPIHGTGRQYRDFVYVADVVNAIMLSVKSKKANGLSLNVASGKTYRVIDIVKEMNKLINTDIKPDYTPPRPGDVFATKADISLIKKTVGYKPKVNFKEGLKKTLKYYKG
jgi:nucleoside-diphosphate-sugar epimerase